MTYGTISGGAVNYGVWNSLYPFNYLTNYGGQYQMNVMPNGISAAEAFEVQQCLNPQFQMNRLIGNLATIPFTMQAPYAVQAAGQQAFYAGASAINNFTVQLRLSTVGNKISCLKAQLQATLANTPGLTDTQKQELEALLRNVEDLERLYNEAAQAVQSGAAAGDANGLIDSLNGAYNEISAAVQETAQRIQAELEAQAAPVSPDDNEGTDPEATDPQATEPQSSGAPTVDEVYGYKQWCHVVAEAMHGAGTDDEQLDTSLSEVNEGNVLELIEQWNQLYADSSYYASCDKHGFIETLIEDSQGSENETRAVVFINALEKRAVLLGINADKEVAEARLAAKGHHPWYHLGIKTRSDSEIINAVNALIKKINDEEARITGKKVITNMDKYI